MNALRIAAMAWTTVGIAWVAKLGVLSASSGRGNAVVGALFIIGALALLVAAAVSGHLVLRRFGKVAGIAGFPIGIVLGFVAHNMLDAVLKALFPVDGWFGDELGILGGALISLAIGLVLFARMRAARTPEPIEAPAT